MMAMTMMVMVMMIMMMVAVLVMIVAVLVVGILKQMRPAVSFHGHSPLQVRPLSPADMGRAATKQKTLPAQTALRAVEHQRAV